jgi:hypothetical protein
MLSRNGVYARLVLCLGCFILSGSGLVTGWLGAVSGTIGTIELATALLRYSPVDDIKTCLHIKADEPKVVIPAGLTTR